MKSYTYTGSRQLISVIVIGSYDKLHFERLQVMKSFELQTRIVVGLISEGVRESDRRLGTVFDLARLEEMQWERIVDLYMAGDFSYNPRPPRGQELSKSETLLRMKQQMTRRFNDIITIFEGLGCITRTVEGGGICATGMKTIMRLLLLSLLLLLL